MWLSHEVPKLTGRYPDFRDVMLTVAGMGLAYVLTRGNVFADLRIFLVVGLFIVWALWLWRSFWSFIYIFQNFHHVGWLRIVAIASTNAFIWGSCALLVADPKKLLIYMLPLIMLGLSDIAKKLSK